jgi:hypothetical protein
MNGRKRRAKRLEIHPSNLRQRKCKHCKIVVSVNMVGECLKCGRQIADYEADVIFVIEEK